MKLEPSRFALTEHENQNWTITVPSGVTVEDTLEPEFFANVSAKLHPYDHIHVRTDDGSYYAELLVLTCGRVWAKCIPIYVINLTSTDVDMTQAADADLEVKHRGPHLKWCVVRKSDNEPLKEELSTKAEAQAWAADFQRRSIVS